MSDVSPPDIYRINPQPIIDAMKAQGLSSHELARNVGCSRTTLIVLLKGRRKYDNRALVGSVCASLRIPVHSVAIPMIFPPEPPDLPCGEEVAWCTEGVGTLILSTSGRAWSLCLGGGFRELFTTSSAGYHVIMTRAPGGPKRHHLAHRLIMAAFCGPPPDGCDVVRHLNDVKTDNRLSNLAYGTHFQNRQDVRRLRGSATYTEQEFDTAVLGGATVRQLRARFEIDASTVYRGKSRLRKQLAAREIATMQAAV